jgi:hypothetical protein
MPEDQLLAELIAHAIEKAIQPLQDRISALDEIIVNLQKEMAALTATQATLSDNQFIQLKLIGQIREATSKEPQPMQKDRADVLKALLVANGGKMLAKDIKKKMHIKKNHFAELLRVCDFAETRAHHLDRRQTVIILKSKLVPRD